MILIKTNMGDIKVELDADRTPKTVENFLTYVKEGFYNNTLFHRVIDGFMIQGGGLEAGLSRKETHDSVENEADLGDKNKRGTIAMARTNDPHSATSQFFINLTDNAFLNFRAKNEAGWGYCVFGRVVDGMDVVDRIAKVKTGNMRGYGDVPLEDVVIESMEIVS